MKMDVPEFQYPCYVDVCTFPTQFCNSDKYERRCSPCSRAICRQTNVPLACRYICMKHNELSTTPIPTTKTVAPSKQISSQANDSLASLHLIMSYSAISTTLLVVVLLSFVAYYVHHKKSAKEKRFRTRKRTTSIELEETCFDENERFLHRDPDFCRACKRPLPETHNLNILSINSNSESPPSYATNPVQVGRSNLVSNSNSSSEAGNVSTKTQKVKPLPKKTNDSSIGTVEDGQGNNRLRSLANNINDSEMQTQLNSILSDNTGNIDSDETSLKSSN